MNENNVTEEKALYRCPECGEETEMDPYVAPDEPACPSCWTGWNNSFPVMDRV